MPTLTDSGGRDTLDFFLFLEEMVSVSPFSIILAIDFSYTVFITLRYVSFGPVFFRAFIRKEC
jgi:hypothetical protein